MKNKKVRMYTIIGFAIGVTLAVNTMLFSFGGGFLYNLALGPILDRLPLSEEIGWVAAPLFVIFIYTIIGNVIGRTVQKK